MLATQLPTCMRCVASPISSTVASTSLLTSAANTAAKPASSASRATRRISAARHPTPGISPNAKPSCTVRPPTPWLRGTITPSRVDAVLQATPMDARADLRSVESRPEWQSPANRYGQVTTALRSIVDLGLLIPTQAKRCLSARWASQRPTVALAGYPNARFASNRGVDAAGNLVNVG